MLHVNSKQASDHIAHMSAVPWATRPWRICLIQPWSCFTILKPRSFTTAAWSLVDSGHHACKTGFLCLWEQPCLDGHRIQQWSPKCAIMMPRPTTWHPKWILQSKECHLCEKLVFATLLEPNPGFKPRTPKKTTNPLLKKRQETYFPKNITIFAHGVLQVAKQRPQGCRRLSKWILGKTNENLLCR